MLALKVHASPSHYMAQSAAAPTKPAAPRTSACIVGAAPLEVLDVAFAVDLAVLYSVSRPVIPNFRKCTYSVVVVVVEAAIAGAITMAAVRKMFSFMMAMEMRYRDRMVLYLSERKEREKLQLGVDRVDLGPSRSGFCTCPNARSCCCFDPSQQQHWLIRIRQVVPGIPELLVALHETLAGRKYYDD